MLPTEGLEMEDCPDGGWLTLFSVLSGLIGLALFLVVMLGVHMVSAKKASASNEAMQTLAGEGEFTALQMEMFSKKGKDDARLGSHAAGDEAKQPPVDDEAQPASPSVEGAAGVEIELEQRSCGALCV